MKKPVLIETLDSIREGDIVIKTITDSSYTPALVDKNVLMLINNANPITVTIPQITEVGFSVGSQLLFCPIGAGEITFTADTNVTILCAGGKNVTNETYSMAALIKIAVNTWLLSGDLKLGLS